MAQNTNQNSESSRLVLPKLAEIQIDEQTETTIKTLIQYVTILEQNQVELVRMITTILNELPNKLQQKVDKYMQYYQNNVVDKQINELDSTLTQLTTVVNQQQDDCNVDVAVLNNRIEELEKIYNFEQMSQLFEDVAQIKQMLGQLQAKL
ncbi:Conserved_hypothetical protein [Hexamita inflata]|uniref:Uncharacterized protein n=1 Tax=Hexamita inflata TaxID=28002 RepID=A0AA86NX25_9EUKA|nr:Conserved hypothetical protein [Hexamita inflata]CAI9931389.1 Conserved hypothetical protein [Hexamita inflata]